MQTQDLGDLDALEKQAKREGNLSAVAMFGRLKVSLREHIRKSKAPDPLTDGKVLIDTGEIAAAAARCRKRWHDMLARMGDFVATAPKCPTCGQHRHDQLALSLSHQKAIEEAKAERVRVASP